MSRPADGLELSDAQRAELVVMARSRVLAYRVVVEARALLDAADGVANEEIARRCVTTSKTVRRWRARFVEQGVAGVGTVAPGRGRKPVISDAVREAIVVETRTTRPADDSTRWTTRSLGAAHGVGKDSVARLWRQRKLKPWLVEGFKLSNDPEFESKLVDVVGLYLNPPERAVVFAFDEKTQCQALDRTQPSLPMKPGRGRTMTHDDKRHGTTDLFAAMNIGTGEVLYDTRRSHKATDVLAFFKVIDLHVPAGLEVHVILDNLSAHKAPAVKKWLADPKRSRWHLHFTPTSSSWLNLAECWFSILTRRRLTKASFTSVQELRDAIELWAEAWNENPVPFTWTKTIDDILTKVGRARTTLNQVTKSATHH